MKGEVCSKFIYSPQCPSESQRGQFVASCSHPRPEHSRTESGGGEGRNGREGSRFFSDIQHTHTEHTLKTQTNTHSLAHTRCEHRLTRETWAQRQSVTTSRKEKILEDRQGRFRDPDPSCQKLHLYTKLCPPLSPVSASTHSTGV